MRAQLLPCTLCLLLLVRSVFAGPILGKAGSNVDVNNLLKLSKNSKTPLPYSSAFTFPFVKPEIVDVDVKVRTQRQIDLMKRLKNFILPDIPETRVDEYIDSWIDSRLVKWTYDRIEFLLVHKEVASWKDVHNSVYKVQQTEYRDVPLEHSLARALALKSSTCAEEMKKSVAIVISEAKMQIEQEILLLKNFLPEHTHEKRTVDEALASALSKGLAADLRKFQAARVVVDRAKKEETVRLKSCFVLPVCLRSVPHNDELHWMANLYGPDFEERLRIFAAIKIARRENEEEKKYLSHSELLGYDDDKKMTERVYRYFADGKYALKTTKSMSKLKEAMEQAQRMAVVVNAVRYDQDLALHSLLSNGDQYAEWFFRYLAKMAVGSLSPRAVKTLMKISNSANEDLREALIELVQFRVDNVYTVNWALRAGILLDYYLEVMDYLVNHELAISPVIDEAYNLAIEGSDHVMADKLEPKIKKTTPKKSKISSFIASL